MAIVPVVEDNYIGDGVTRVFGLTWPYLSPSDVAVSVNGVNVGYAWLAGSSTTVQTNTAPPAGSKVRVYRNTAAEEVDHVFSGGVPFLPRYIDENAKQLLYALQEGIALFDGVADQAQANLTRAIRVDPFEDPLNLLPAPTERAGKFLTFDAAGQPSLVVPAAGSAAELAAMLSAATGALLIGAQMPGVGNTSVQGALNFLNQQANLLAAKVGRFGISPFAYGAVGDGVTDDTAACLLAFNAAKAARVPFLVDGNFAVTSLVLDGMNGCTICFVNGAFTGKSTGSYPFTLGMKNSSDFCVFGRGVVSSSWNVGYSCGIQLFTDNGTQLSNATFFPMISVVGAQIGVRFGSLTAPDALVSELTAFGGYFYGCPTAYEAIGTQTVVNLVGCNIITGVNGAPAGVAAAWAALPRTAVRYIGASVTLTGGEVLIVDVANGLLFDALPITSGVGSIGNRYGSLYVKGTTIETASPIWMARNPDGIGSLVPDVGCFSMEGCPGFHSQNSANLISGGASYDGRIDIGANNIGCPIARTFANIDVANVNCKITVQPNSFGRNFPVGAAGVQGGTLMFPWRMIARMENMGVQSLPIGLTDLKPSTVRTDGGLLRWSGTYNAGTGVYTTKQPLKQILVTCSYQVNTATATGETKVIINGTDMGICSNATRTQITGGDVAEFPTGTTIKVQVNNTGVTGQSTTAGAKLGYIEVWARND